MDCANSVQAGSFATGHSCNGWAQWKTRWAINRRLPPASKLFFAALAVIVRHGMAISSGLARVIDDGEMLAYMHWVLVNPKYQGMHVGSGLAERVKERYAGYMFLEVMPEESKNAPFYQRHGFTLMEDGRAMQTVTRS